VITSRKSWMNKKVLLIVLVLIVVGVGGVAGSILLRPHSELAKLKEAIGRHYLLPNDEQPALLTVVDKDKLSSSYLKQYAEDGDKILIYQEYQRVIIYRPSADRIVDIGPAVIESPTPSDE
jgi:hypothetical protein